MMIVELVGRWGDVLETIPLPPLCVTISVREDPTNDCNEHFPKHPGLLDWDKNRQISDLSEPPPEVR